ncbi:hypothetical protein LINGRAHAP2_LOCUS33244 [Linum grandiflorum]
MATCMDMAQATLYYHRTLRRNSSPIIKSDFLLTDVCSATGRLKKNQSRHRQLRFQLKFPSQSHLCSSLQLQCRASASTSIQEKSGVRFHSLMLLEWDKLCDLVASFASTSMGRQATIAQLWKLNNSYDDSLMLLRETNAALQLRSHGGCRLEFVGLDLLLVESAIQHARRRLNVGGNEAIAIAALLDSALCLQLNLKSAVKEDADWYSRFLPLSQVIMDMVINRSLVKMIQQVVDEDGSIKDSASSALKRSRAQVRMLEEKLYRLMDTLIRNQENDTSFLEVSNVDGRWCVQSGPGQQTNVKGLLLSRCIRCWWFS